MNNPQLLAHTQPVTFPGLRLGIALIGALGMSTGCAAPANMLAATAPLGPVASISPSSAPAAASATTPATRPATRTESSPEWRTFSPALTQGFSHYTKPSGPPEWEPGGVRLTGFLGATEFTNVSRRAGGGEVVNGDSDLTTPSIGGGGQWKLAGNRVTLGVEGLMSLNFRGSATAVAVGGGGAAIAVDINMLLVDFYGGPFLSLWLGDKLRAYGAAGPMVQFADYEQDSVVDGFDGRGSGFGTGWYGRLGVEMLTGGGTSVGIGARFSDTRIDLDSGLGDLDLEGVQYLISVTTGW